MYNCLHREILQYYLKIDQLHYIMFLIFTVYQKSKQIQDFCSQALTTMPTYSYTQGDLDGQN